MATVKPSPPTLWHKQATTTLRTLLAARRMSYKQLSRTLEVFGEKVPEKTLGNKINRGTFSFIFFLQCMYALGRSDVRFLLPDLSNEELMVLRAVKKKVRKAPPPKAKASRTGVSSKTS